MSKAYILIFNDGFSTREELVKVLDRCTTVNTWRYDMTNAIYIISDNTAFEIAEELERIHPPQNNRYMVLEYTNNAQGRVSGESWFLLNNKYHQPEA